MSINKAQAKALAEGFLDEIGNDPTEFRPLECVTEALTIAGEFVDIAQQNCPVHGGKLAASIQAEEPKEYGFNGISVEITMAAYGQFVEKGVRGTKGGTGLYAFKNDMPSAKMVKDFIEYIKTSTLSTANVKNRPIGKHEVKHTSISKAQSAFAMARAVKQHGIKPVGFISRAAQVVESKYSSVLRDALTKDLYNSLPNTL